MNPSKPLFGAFIMTNTYTFQFLFTRFILQILPQHIFNKKDPIVMGVDIVDGTLRMGTGMLISFYKIYI